MVLQNKRPREPLLRPSASVPILGEGNIATKKWKLKDPRQSLLPNLPEVKKKKVGRVSETLMEQGNRILL